VGYEVNCKTEIIKSWTISHLLLPLNHAPFAINLNAIFVVRTAGPDNGGHIKSREPRKRFRPGSGSQKDESPSYMDAHSHGHTTPANLLHKHNFETDTRLAKLRPPNPLANGNILGNLGSKLQAIHANGLEQRVALKSKRGGGVGRWKGRTTWPGQIIFRAAPKTFRPGHP